MDKTVTFQINDLFRGKKIVIELQEDGYMQISDISGEHMICISSRGFITGIKGNRFKAGGDPEIGFGSIEILVEPDPRITVEGSLDPEVYASIVALDKK